MKGVSHRSPSNLYDAGFTLLELLLALIVSALIGVAAAAMLAAAASASDPGHDTRATTLNRQFAIIRAAAQVRGGGMILDRRDASLVLWTGDANGNGKPNLSELRRLTWDADKQEMLAHAAPAGLAPGDDTSYEWSDDFEVITASLAGDANFPEQLLLDNVTDWSVTLDNANPRKAREAKLTITCVTPTGNDRAVVIVSLRATAPEEG